MAAFGGGSLSGGSGSESGGGSIGTAALFEAAARFDLPVISTYLNNGGDPNVLSSGSTSQETLLHTIIRRWGPRVWDPIPDVLLSAGINLDTRNGKGESLLTYAVTYSVPSMVRWLLLNGASNEPVEDQLTPMQLAAKLALKVKSSTVDNVAQKIVEMFQEWVAYEDDEARLDALVKSWRVMEIRDRSAVFSEAFLQAETCLETKPFEDFQKLIENRGLDVNFSYESEAIGRTLLMTTARLGDAKACTYLIHKGAHVNAQDSSGRTALHYAVHRKSGPSQLACVIQLLKGGANPAISDHARHADGLAGRGTPANYARDLSMHGHSAMADFIRELSGHNTASNKGTVSRLNLEDVSGGGGGSGSGERRRDGGSGSGSDSKGKGTAHWSDDPLSSNPHMTARQRRDLLRSYSPRVYTVNGLEVVDEFQVEKTHLERMEEQIAYNDVKGKWKVGMSVQWDSPNRDPSGALYGLVSGTIRYVGRLHCADGTWVGVALDKPAGDCDGTKENKRYFRVESGNGCLGVFVRPEELIPKHTQQ